MRGMQRGRNDGSGRVVMRGEVRQVQKKARRKKNDKKKPEKKEKARKKGKKRAVGHPTYPLPDVLSALGNRSGGGGDKG